MRATRSNLLRAWRSPLVGYFASAPSATSAQSKRLVPARAEDNLAPSAAVIVISPVTVISSLGHRPVRPQSSSPQAPGLWWECPDPGPGPLWRTLPTVLTVFANLVCILMSLLPVRPSRAKAISIPRARRNVCARRRRPASARGFFGQAAVPLEVSLLSVPARRRSAALHIHDLRPAMISRTHAATGSASMMLSMPALRFAA